jgi:hypothetical protein
MFQNRLGRLFFLACAVLFAGGAAASADTLTLTWDANADAVAGYYVYVGSSPGSYSQRIDVGNVTQYDVAAVVGQRYCFAVSAYAAGHSEGQRSNEVCTTDGTNNTAPTLSNPGNQTIPVAQPFSLWLSAVDPEGDTLSYTVTGLPSGLSAATATGMISGTPTATGASTVTATVSDGELSATVSFTLTVNGTAPGAATLLRPSGSISATGVTFEWTPVPTATKYRLWVDDASTSTLVRDLTPAEAGCSSGTVCRSNPGFTLVTGAGSWSVRASNTYGDGPWSGSMDFTVAGNRAPTVTITSPTSATTYAATGSTVALAGTASDDVAVTQVTWTTDKGASGTAAGTSSWSVPAVALQPGPNVITVTARDGSNSTGTDVLTVTLAVDSQAPTVTILTQPSAALDASKMSSPSVTVTGTASDNVGVTEVRWSNSQGGSGVATGTTSWSTGAVALKQGANVITVTARDAAGNTGTSAVTLSLTDGQAPTVSIAAPVSTPTFATTLPTVALAGTSADASGVVAVTWANSQGGSGTATGTTAWSVPAVALVPGVNVITVSARDAVGNTGKAQLSVTVTDSRAPVVTITSNGLTAPSVLQVVGTASDNFGVAQVSWRTARGATGVATGTTSWVAAGIPIQQGSNEVTITAIDRAGNSASSTLKVNGRIAKFRDFISDALNPSTSETLALATTGDTAALTAGTTTSTPPTTDSSAPQSAPWVVILPSVIDGRWVTTAGTVPLKGTASDNVTRVTWSVDWGGSGTASGTQQWTIPTIGLQIGTNVIAVTATTADGQIARQTVTVTYRPRGNSK